MAEGATIGLAQSRSRLFDAKNTCFVMINFHIITDTIEPVFIVLITS
jgi:hypothetical protein